MRIVMLAIAMLLITSPVLAGGLEVDLGSPGAGLTVPQEVVMGGYMDVAYINVDGMPSTFALAHFNPTLSAGLSDQLMVEAQLEWGSSMRGMNDLVGGGDGDLVYAYLDWVWKDSLILRVGSFLVPFNVYNTNLYAPTVAKLTARPLPLVDIVPVKWNDVGVQLRGIIETGTDATLNYAVYYVNGLQANTVLVITEDADTGEDVITAVTPTDISNMRGNSGDLDGDKAYGGRIGIAAGNWEAGISGYTGAYDEAGNLDLTLVGFDLAYVYENFEFRSEYAKADQDVNSSLDKDGFYVEGSYKFLEKWEVVARYGEADLDTGGASHDRVLVGGNYFIADNLTLRLSYAFADIGNQDADGLFTSMAVEF